VLQNRSASFDPFVLERIRNAEALFIAGGDQSNYVNYWMGTPVEDAIHDLASNEIPIAGTSAGTAILSEFVYAALRQSAISSKAVLVDASGDATIVANADHPTPYAYFIRGGTPEVCQPKTPLTYRNLEVFRAEPGSRFDIPSWSGHNGTSYSLDVVNGVITSTQPGGSIY
jgi:hypothetical protein